MVQPALLLVILLSFSASGCAGDEKAPATVSQQPTSGPAPTSTDVPTTTTPTAAAPTPTATTTAPTATTTTPTATTGVPPSGGENQPGGAGDEEPARTPAAFTVDAAGIRPQRITVAAFLAVDVAITAKGAPHRVVVDAPGGGPVDVAEGGTAHQRLDGLKPGDYAIVTDTGARATLHVVPGGAPGP